MIHLSNKAKEVCDYLNQHGFKVDPQDRRERPVYISAQFTSMEEDREYILDPDNPEMTPQEFENRLRDYCCFVAEADLSSVMPEENPYIDMDLVAADVRYQYEQKFKEYLRKQFGDDVEIRSTGYHGGNAEFEIERKAVVNNAR